MIFNAQEIQEILKIIDLHTAYLVGYNLGTDVFSDDDKKLLKKYGIDVDELQIDYPPYLQAFLWGRLSALLNEYQATQVTYPNFMDYVKSREWEPLSTREKAEYEIARQKTYGHIKNIGSKIKTEVNDIIFTEDQATRTEQERVIAGELEAGVLNRKSLQSIVSHIGTKTKNWNVDWGRIVDTEMQDIFNRGRAEKFREKFGGDQKVYKETYAGACRWCIRLHTTGGIGSEPIYFTLDQLAANGTNIGLPKEQWKAVVGPVHPFCFVSDTEVLTDQGWQYFSNVTGVEKYLSVDLSTNNAEWVKATKKIEYHYEGLVNDFKSNDFSLETTPYHYHVVNKKKDKNKWELIEADRIKKYDRLLRNIPAWQGNMEDSIEIGGYSLNKMDMVEFMAYYLSDGNISRNQIKITQDREKSQYYNDIENCCKRIFTKIGAGKTAIYITLTRFGQEFIDSFKKLGKCNEKYIPSWIKNSSTEYLECFLKSYVKCDGTIKKGKYWKGSQFSDELSYYTVSDQLAADIGEIILKTGKTPSYNLQPIKTTVFKNGTYTGNFPIWRVTITKKRASQYYVVNKGQKYYSGMVYDVELEKNHTLIVRHNGKVCVSGNCRCNLEYVPDDKEWDKKKKDFVFKKPKNKVERVSKVKITIGNQKFEI